MFIQIVSNIIMSNKIIFTKIIYKKRCSLDKREYYSDSKGNQSNLYKRIIIHYCCIYKNHNV